MMHLDTRARSADVRDGHRDVSTAATGRLPRLGFCEMIDRTHCKDLVLNRLDKCMNGFNLKKFHEGITEDLVSAPDTSSARHKARGRLVSLKNALHTVQDTVPATKTLVKAILVEFDGISDMLEREAGGVKQDIITTAMKDMSAELKAARDANKRLQAMWAQATARADELEAERNVILGERDAHHALLQELTDNILQCQVSSGEGHVGTPLLDGPGAGPHACQLQDPAEAISKLRDELETLRARDVIQQRLLDQVRRGDAACEEENKELEERLAACHEALQEAQKKNRAMGRTIKTLEHELDRHNVDSPFVQIASLKEQVATLITDVQHSISTAAQQRVILGALVKGRVPSSAQHLCGSQSQNMWPVRVDKVKKKDKFATFGDKLDGQSVPCFLRGKSVQSTRYRQLTAPEAKQFVKDFFAARHTFEGFQNSSIATTGRAVAMDVYFEKYLHARYNIREQMMEWAYSMYSFAAKHAMDDFDLLIFTRVTERTLPYCFWEHTYSLVDSAKAALGNLKGVSYTVKDIMAVVDDTFPNKTVERQQLLHLALCLDVTDGTTFGQSAAASVDRDVLLSEKSNFMQELKRQIVFEHDDMSVFVRHILINMTSRKSEGEHLMFQQFTEFITPLVTEETLEIIMLTIRTKMDTARKKKLQSIANMAAGGGVAAATSMLSKKHSTCGQAKGGGTQPGIVRGWFADRAADGSDEIVSLPVSQYLTCMSACVAFVPSQAFRLDLAQLSTFELPSQAVP